MFRTAADGCREARPAVNDAMPILVRAKSVTILVVDDGGDTELIDARSMVEVVRHLHCHGVRAETRGVRSKGVPIAECLQAEAANHAADLLVLRGYSHDRAAEFRVDASPSMAPNA